MALLVIIAFSTSIDLLALSSLILSILSSCLQIVLLIVKFPFIIRSWIPVLFHLNNFLCFSLYYIHRNISLKELPSHHLLKELINIMNITFTHCTKFVQQFAILCIMPLIVTIMIIDSSLVHICMCFDSFIFCFLVVFII